MMSFKVPRVSQRRPNSLTEPITKPLFRLTPYGCQMFLLYYTHIHVPAYESVQILHPEVERQFIFRTV